MKELKNENKRYFIKNMICCLFDFLFKPLVWLNDKSRNLRLVYQANLPRNAKVLEIGSGHNPWPRSNVLCDLYPYDDTERSGPIKIDNRPFFVVDAAKLPFPDKSFDFIFCSHLAEHIDDIASFFKEIQRVGKAGYIETPNYLFEQAVGTTTHVWAFFVGENNTLVAEKKIYPGAPEKVYHGWHGAIAKHSVFRFCMEFVPELRPFKFWWNGKFDFLILPTPEPMKATRANQK